jgi:hypothetical protein
MMAGLEVVVRPVVFPDIRPRAKQSLPPQDDPEKGMAVIKGNPGKVVALPESWSINSSFSKPTEKERRVDEARTYQQNEDGTVNKENFVDIDVANRITMEEGRGGGQAGPGESGGSGGPGEQGGGGDTVDKTYFYQRVKEGDNIKIIRRNIIQRVGP